MDKNFFHNHFIYKHRKRIAFLLLIGFLGSPLGGVLPARAAEEAKVETAVTAPSGGFMQDVILGPMKTFFSGLASFNYGDFLKLIIKDSLNTVVDRFYSQVVKSFEDEYLVQDYNRQVFVPYLDFGFAKFHNWVADQVGDAKIDAPLLNAFLGLENLAYRGLKETGTKLSHSVLKELDQVSKEMRGENSPPSPSDHDYMSKLMSGLWGNPHDLFWGAAGKTLDVGAASEAQGGQDYLISEGHNNGRKVTDMPEEIESYFLKKGDVLTAPAPTTANPLPFPSALGKKLQDWGYTRIFSPANGAVSGYSLASKGTYYLHDSAPFGLEIWSWDANFPFFLLCSKSGDNYVIDGMRTLTKPNVWQDPQEVYPASIAFTSRAISDPLASGWTGLIKRPGQKVKVMVNDLIESKLKIAGDASDLSGVSRIIYDLGKTYLTNVNFKVKRATSGALTGCPVGFEVIEPDLGTTMGRMGEPTKPSAGQCLIAALKQVDTNFLGEMVGWLSDLGKKLICWIFDRKNLVEEKGYLGADSKSIGTQEYKMVKNKDKLNDPSLNLTDAERNELEQDPEGSSPVLVLVDGELKPQVGDYKRKDSPLSLLGQYIFYEEIIKPLMPDKIKSAAEEGFNILATLIGKAVGAFLGSWVGGKVEEALKKASPVMGDIMNAYMVKKAVQWLLDGLGFCEVKSSSQPKIEEVNLPQEGRYDFLEFPYRLTEKNNVTALIYVQSTDAAFNPMNAPLYRTLIFKNVPAGVHIARWDFSSDLNYQERNMILDKAGKVNVYVRFQKEQDEALSVFQGYDLPGLKEEVFWGKQYAVDPTTAAKNCYNESYSNNANPCGLGYLIQNYMLELPQDPSVNQSTEPLNRPFAPIHTFYQNEQVPITMRYQNNGSQSAENVNVKLYDIPGVEASMNSFFGQEAVNFWDTNILLDQAKSHGVKPFYEGNIAMPINCSNDTINKPGCEIATRTWSADTSGAHALVMVFDSDKDQNKLNNRIVQIVNVSDSPVIVDKYKMIDGPKTADSRSDGDHPDGDGTGVANPGEDIELGVDLKNLTPLTTGFLEVYIDLKDSPFFQYVGDQTPPYLLVDTDPNRDNNLKAFKLNRGLNPNETFSPRQDLNFQVKNDAPDGDYTIPLYIREYGTGGDHIIYRQDIPVKVRTRCNDGVDNDKDTFIDKEDLLGCTEPIDNSEDDDTNIAKRPDLIPVGMTYKVVPQCNDKKDNDGDGKTDYPADLNCASKDDITEGGARGIFKDAELTLNFQIKNQGEGGIWPNTPIPISIYVCYGKPTTYAEGWSFNRGYYKVELPVDECYCEPRPPASSSALGTVPENFALPGSGFPTADEITNSYQDYINCIEEKYKPVTSFNYITDTKVGWGSQVKNTISTPFKVLEDKNMRFAIVVDGKVDSNFNETEGNIPEYIETNNKAGFPDYFCKDNGSMAYLTLDSRINMDSITGKKPPKYLSPVCMDSFSAVKDGDYRIRIGEKSWTPSVGGGVVPSPFQYLYTCSSNDQCSSKPEYAASCNADTVGDWNVNSAEYVLLTIKVKNTTNKDVKSYFILTDGPGSKANIGSLTIPPLTSNPLLFESGEEKSLYFYVHIPPKSTDGHIYNNNDTINLTLKGRETKDSPEFIVAANLPIKLGQKLDARCLDKPKEVEPKPFVNLEMKDVSLIKSSNNPKKLTPGFQIKNGSSIGVPPLTNVSYEYMLRYFKEEPTGTRDRGCYRTFDALRNFTETEGLLATMSSGQVEYPLKYKDVTYTVGNTDEDYGFYQTYAKVNGKSVMVNGILVNESDNADNYRCSDFVEVKKPDVDVTAVTLLKTMFTANQDTFTGTFTVKNNGSEEIPGNNIDYVWELYEGNNSEPVNKGTGNVGQKMPAGAVATIKLKNGGNIGVGYPGKSYSLVVEITVPDKYDEDKSNNNRASAASSPLPVAGWSKTGANSQPNALTLTQRIKRVLNYVRAKLGD